MSLSTPIHGRARFVTLDDGLTWLVKGVGWTFGPPYFLPSPKDAQLYFGLYDRRDAVRELKVSAWLEARAIRAARVGGYTEMPEAWVQRIGRGRPLCYKDGTPLNPVRLYTHTLIPHRVADLAYFDDARKVAAVAETAGLCVWPTDPDGFVRAFAAQLTDTVLRYHALDCVNDSLSWDNCTLAAEPIDYEWFSVPGIPLPDGTEPTIRLAERQQKELIYIAEIAIQLAALLQTRVTLMDTLEPLRARLRVDYPDRWDHYRDFFDSIDAQLAFTPPD